jgi:H/ACA ribonucleoprotein complex subunit 4
MDESSQGDASDRKEKKRKRISDVTADENVERKHRKKEKERSVVDEDIEAKRERKRLRKEKKAAKEAAKVIS